MAELFYSMELARESMMISVTLRGIIADIDETTPDEPGHPAAALVMEVGDRFSRGLRFILSPSFARRIMSRCLGE